MGQAMDSSELTVELTRLALAWNLRVRWVATCASHQRRGWGGKATRGKKLKERVGNRDWKRKRRKQLMPTGQQTPIHGITRCVPTAHRPRRIAERPPQSSLKRLPLLAPHALTAARVSLGAVRFRRAKYRLMHGCGPRSSGWAAP